MMQRKSRKDGVKYIAEARWKHLSNIILERRLKRKRKIKIGKWNDIVLLYYLLFS